MTDDPRIEAAYEAWYDGWSKYTIGPGNQERVARLRIQDALAAADAVDLLRQPGMVCVDARIEQLPAEWENEIDWSTGRNSYGDNAAYERCANDLRRVLVADRAAGIVRVNTRDEATAALIARAITSAWAAHMPPTQARAVLAALRGETQP